MAWGSLLFSFEGRINRAKYWLAALVYSVLLILLWLLSFALGPDSITVSLLYMIIGIGVFISAIAIGVKRLHDRNRTGWWLLLFYVLPGFLVTAAAVHGLIAAGSAMTDAPGAAMASVGVAGVLMLAAILIIVWALIELGCLRGTTGSNRFGPDPLEPPEKAPVH